MPSGRALALLIFFGPLLDGGTTFVSATLVRLGALALAVAWLWGRAGGTAAVREPTGLDLPIVLFFGLAALSVWTSPDQNQSLHGFLGLASGALAFAVATETARTSDGRWWIGAAIVGGALVQACLAFVQQAGGAARPAGTYVNANHLALALAVAGSLVLAQRPRSRRLAAAALVTVVVLSAALLSTASRGGALAATAGWGLVAWLRWRRRGVAAAAVVALALVVVPNPLSERLRGLADRNHLAYTRLDIWRSAIERGVDHPLGIGLNLFQQSSEQYAFPIEGEVARYGRRAESAHNDYLHLFAELGAAGLGLALWTLTALARATARGIRAAGYDSEAWGWRVGAAGGLTALAVQAFVDTPLRVPGLVVQGAALAGIAVAAAAGRPAICSDPASVLRRRLALACAALVAALGVGRHGAAYLVAKRADELRRSSGPAAALPWYARAERLVPGRAEFPDAIAATSLAAWRASGDPRFAVQAEQAMLRAIRLDARQARRRVRLAYLYQEIVPTDAELRRRTLARAVALYEEAEQLDPYEARYSLARAELLLRLGDTRGAGAALDRAIGLEPRLLKARLLRARFLAAAGDRLGALADYEAIASTLETYRTVPARGPYAAEFLAVDPAVVRAEAEILKAEILKKERTS